LSDNDQSRVVLLDFVFVLLLLCLCCAFIQIFLMVLMSLVLL